MGLYSLVPGSVRARLEGRTVVRRVLGNSGWMFADQLWRMFLSLAVGIWVARYLGPELYGRLSYATALAALGAPLSGLGLASVLVRDFVRSKESGGLMLGTAVKMKIVAGCVTLMATVAVVWILEGTLGDVFWLVLAIACSPLFQAVDVIDYWLQANDRYPVSAMVKTIAATASALVKVGLILGHAPLLMFGIVAVLEIAACGLGWYVAWRCSTGKAGAWSWNPVLAGKWLRETWPVMIAGLAVQVQAQFDQVLIGRLLPASELGQYSAALRLVTALAFVPVVLQTASAPEIARAKMESEASYCLRLHRLYRAMVIAGLLLAVPFCVYPQFIAWFLLGSGYAGAGVLLPIMGFRLILTGLGVARGLFVANEGLFHQSMVGAVAGGLVSLLLNFLWIPRWGVYGALMASYLSLIITTFAVDAAMPGMRRNCLLMMRALVMPWRGIQH